MAVRNFGVFIKSMTITSPNELDWHDSRIWAETVSLHSAEPLTELDIDGLNITVEIALMLEALIECLRSLTLQNCKRNKLFEKMLNL